ncbi:MAG: DUF4339 domain-containing protein [Bacteroidales bacterium]|nr:DUF4339 domain-containing protein [Bacteroidales bacterium]
MQYYLYLNGVRLGPYSKEELRLQGITQDSIVWRPGMTDWALADSVPDLADILADSAFGAYAEKIKTEQPSPSTPTPPPFNPWMQGFNNMPIPHTNWLPWAIIVTIIGLGTSCIAGIFGIIAIINASRANDAYARGMQAKGDANNSTAKIMTIIGIILCILGILGISFYGWNVLNQWNIFD